MGLSKETKVLCSLCVCKGKMPKMETVLRGGMRIVDEKQTSLNFGVKSKWNLEKSTTL